MSVAKPRFSDNACRLDMGKPTLMVWAVTPALLRLALSGGVTLAVTAPALAFFRGPLDDPEPATAKTMPTRRTRTTAKAAPWARTGRRRKRRHDRPSCPPPGLAIVPLLRTVAPGAPSRHRWPSRAQDGLGRPNIGGRRGSLTEAF